MSPEYQEACERTVEIETARKCIDLLLAMPSRGLYRLGVGYHPPSYDDAWRVAAQEIFYHFKLTRERPPSDGATDPAEQPKPQPEGKAPPR